MQGALRFYLAAISNIKDSTRQTGWSPAVAAVLRVILGIVKGFHRRQKSPALYAGMGDRLPVLELHAPAHVSKIQLEVLLFVQTYGEGTGVAALDDVTRGGTVPEAEHLLVPERDHLALPADVTLPCPECPHVPDGTVDTYSSVTTNKLISILRAPPG